MMMHEAMGARKPGPQGERDMSVKTIMQGMPGDPAEPCMVTAASFSFCRRAMGAASFRHSLRPSSLKGRSLGRNSWRFARENAAAYPVG
jgi:hypothetical protein